MGTRGPRPKTLDQVYEEMFSRLDTSAGPEACHEYTRSQTKAGYGQIQARGISSNPLYVHRLMYQFHNGPIPEGYEVRHTCDNPPCANIKHLVLGGHWDNMQDAIRRGRFKIGGDHRRFLKEA